MLIVMMLLLATEEQVATAPAPSPSCRRPTGPTSMNTPFGLFGSSILAARRAHAAADRLERVVLADDARAEVLLELEHRRELDRAASCRRGCPSSRR